MTPELGTLSGCYESLCEHQRLGSGGGWLGLRSLTPGAGTRAAAKTCVSARDGGQDKASVSDPRGECDSHCSSHQPLSRGRLLPTRTTQGQLPWESAQAGSGCSNFPQRLSLQALSAHPNGVCHIPSSPWPELASEWTTEWTTSKDRAKAKVEHQGQGDQRRGREFACAVTRAVFQIPVTAPRLCTLGSAVDFRSKYRLEKGQI